MQKNELKNIGHSNYNGYGFNMHDREFKLKRNTMNTHTHSMPAQFLSQMKKQFISIPSINPSVRLAKQFHFVFWLLMKLNQKKSIQRSTKKEKSSSCQKNDDEKTMSCHKKFNYCIQPHTGQGQKISHAVEMPMLSCNFFLKNCIISNTFVGLASARDRTVLIMILTGEIKKVAKRWSEHLIVEFMLGVCMCEAVSHCVLLDMHQAMSV